MKPSLSQEGDTVHVDGVKEEEESWRMEETLYMWMEESSLDASRILPERDTPTLVKLGQRLFSVSGTAGSAWQQCSDRHKFVFSD